MTLRQVGRPLRVRSARRLVQIAGLIFYLLAVQALMTAGVGIYVYLSSKSAPDLLLPAMSLVLAGSYTGIGYFVRRYRLWARNVAFAFAAVSLFAFPVGTVLGVLVVVCIDRANRANVFPTRQAGVRASGAFLADERATIRRFEPLRAGQEFAPEWAG